MSMVAWAILKIPYVTTYPPDGYNHITQRFNGCSFVNDEYLFHPLTIITSFAGLPNRDLSGNGKQSILNLFKNMIGWIDGRQWWRISLNLIKLIPLTAWNLIASLARLLTHVLKLGTEFFPLILVTLIGYLSGYLGVKIANCTDKSLVSYLVLGSCSGLYCASMLSYLIVSMIYLLGRATTSPDKSVKAAWFFGLQLGGRSLIGYSMSTAFALTSILVTVLIYGVTLPIAVKYLSLVLLPHAPASVMMVVNAVSHYVLPLFSLAGKTVLMPILKPLFSLLGVTVSPAMVTLAMAAGLYLSTVGTAIRRVIDKFKNWRQHCLNRSAMNDSPPESSDGYQVIPEAIENLQPSIRTSQEGSVATKPARRSSLTFFQEKNPSLPEFVPAGDKADCASYTRRLS